MRPFYFICSYLCCIFVAAILAIVHKNMTETTFKEVINNQLKHDIYSHYFDQQSISFEKNRIIVKLNDKKPFIDLKNEDKFVLLNVFQQEIEYLLQYKIHNPLHLKDIWISVESNDDTYLFKDAYANKKNMHIRNGQLFINNDRLTENEVINTPEFHNTYIKPWANDTTSSGFREYDIILFMDKYFKIMTKNLADAHPSDERLIVAWAMEKFQLKQKEIIELYLKWNYDILLSPFKIPPA